MMNFKDMGLEKFVRDYKDMNPDLLELSRELYKENKSLPDKYRLTNSQLDMEIRNDAANAYTGLDLKNKKEALVKQEGLLQEILNGYDLVKQSIDEYSNKEKPEKDINDKLNELATKAVQAVRDVPENVELIKNFVQREIEHQLDPAVMKNTVEQGLVKVGTALGATRLEGSAEKPLTDKEQDYILENHPEFFTAKTPEDRFKVLHQARLELMFSIPTQTVDVTKSQGRLQKTLRGEE